MDGANPSNAEAFLSALAKPDREILPAPKPSDLLKGKKSRVLRGDWDKTHWVQQALRREFVTTTILAIFAVGLWLIVLTNPKAQTMQFQAEPTLHDSTVKWMGSDIGPNYDDLTLFLHETLTLLYEITPSGAPYRTLLRGRVNDKILSDADNYLAGEMPTIRKQGIHQEFQLDPIHDSDIVYDPASERASITVHGTFILSFEANPKAKTIYIPYAARIVLSKNLPSRIDSDPFFMEELEKPASQK